MSMQQPSAQGIASLYRGNPEPLQQSIQKDQQAKPGLPPDLQKLLALQIVNNEKDGFAAQKALQQLQQMVGPQGGKPPTVMASLEQQAKQKMEAQAQQARQQAEMRGLPAGIMGVQGEPPQPEAQPEAQGIDQSDRVAFAGAEGGIVAFDRGGDVDTAKEAAKAAIAQLQSYGLAQRKDDPEGYETAQSRAAAARERLKAIEAAYAQEMRDAGMDRPAQVTGMPKTPVRPAAPKGLPAAVPMAVSRPTEQMTPQQMEQKVAPAAGIAALVEGRAAPKPEVAATNQGLPAAAPVARPAPAPEPAPEADSDAMRMEKARMNASPEAAEARDIAKYKAAIGAPDTAQHDRLIAELERRKQELAPKSGYAGLMEYLGEISRADSRGRGSFAAGAAGAARLNDLNKERALQQFELSKQAIEVSQKKLDTVRSYAKDVYGVGKASFDQVYKDQYDAAKEIVKDEREARKMAQENTLKRLELENRLEVQRLQNQGSLAAAQVRTEGNNDKRGLDALKAQLASIDKELAPLLKAPYGENKSKIALLQAQKAQVQKDLRTAGGVSTIPENSALFSAADAILTGKK